MNKLMIAFLIFSQVSLGQKYKTLTDTTMSIGVIAEDCYVGESISSYCSNGVDKLLKKRTTVIISGAQTCGKSYSEDKTNFFEIIFNNKTYYIEEEKLLTEPTHFEQISNMSSEMADSFRSNAQKNGQLLYDGEKIKILNFFDKCKTKGLILLDWSFYDESEYTEGTSVRLNVYNPTSKIIKYLWFTFVGFNPVGDKVVDRKRGTNIVMKGVGPLKPDESGTYNYEYVWFTDMVETVKIISVKVQYMDGTIKTILNPNQVTLPQSLFQILSED